MFNSYETVFILGTCNPQQVNEIPVEDIYSGGGSYE